MRRQVVAAAVALVVAGAPVVDAASARAPRCSAFVPKRVPEITPDPKAALTAPVHVVSDKHTEAAPLVLEYAHGVGASVPFTMYGEFDYQYFNLQVRSAAKAPGLHIRAEWPATSPSDVDLYLFDEKAVQVGYGESMNIPVVEDVVDELFYDTYGGLGYESMPGVRTKDCRGYHLWSRTGRSLGTPMTLKVWVGPQTEYYDECCP